MKFKHKLNIFLAGAATMIGIVLLGSGKNPLITMGCFTAAIFNLWVASEGEIAFRDDLLKQFVYKDEDEQVK